jgi:hypothetical protein
VKKLYNEYVFNTRNHLQLSEKFAGFGRWHLSIEPEQFPYDRCNRVQIIKTKRGYTIKVRQ